MSEATLSVPPGTLVADKYRVDRVLGEGGMGFVVAATHEQLDQRVALKFLLPEIAAKKEVVARFLREARAAAKIQSEHVARVIDVGTLHGASPYMVMEFLEGEDLQQTLQSRGPLPVAEAVGYVLQACEAIAEAHSLGIVHRDLKPANLFLARRPSGASVIKVLDFGISKAPALGKEQVLTQADALMGSPDYMSPEQMRASRDVDAQSDIWSLGIVLFELLTHRPPFSGENFAAVVASVLYDATPSLRMFRTDLPTGIESVVNRCLEKDASRRFATIAEFARTLVPLGPPRCELSLERIEHVLDPSGIGRAATLSLSTVSARTDSATLSPSFIAVTGVRRRVVLSAALGIVIGVASVALLLVRFRGHPARPLEPLASASPGPLAALPPSLPSPVITPSAVASTLPVVSPAPVASAPVVVPSVRRPPPAHWPPLPAPEAAPTCKIVSYFDTEGNKHFKKECP